MAYKLASKYKEPEGFTNLLDAPTLKGLDKEFVQSGLDIDREYLKEKPTQESFEEAGRAGYDTTIKKNPYDLTSDFQISDILQPQKALFKVASKLTPDFMQQQQIDPEKVAQEGLGRLHETFKAPLEAMSKGKPVGEAFKKALKGETDTEPWQIAQGFISKAYPDLELEFTPEMEKEHPYAYASYKTARDMFNAGFNFNTDPIIVAFTAMNMASRFKAFKGARKETGLLKEAEMDKRFQEAYKKTVDKLKAMGRIDDASLRKPDVVRDIKKNVYDVIYEAYPETRPQLLKRLGQRGAIQVGSRVKTPANIEGKILEIKGNEALVEMAKGASRLPLSKLVEIKGAKLEPLEEEAKKYKSAEEFVSKKETDIENIVNELKNSEKRVRRAKRQEPSDIEEAEENLLETRIKFEELAQSINLSKNEYSRIVRESKKTQNEEDELDKDVKIIKEKGAWFDSYNLEKDYGRVSGTILNNFQDYKSDKVFEEKNLSIASIQAEKIGKGQGKMLFQDLLDYAKNNEIKYIGSISANEYAKKMLKYFEDKGDISPIAKGLSGDTITWKINKLVSVKTKQQLTDIYNKAQEVKPKEVKAESVALDKKVAETFEEGFIEEAILPKNTKILTVKEIPKELQNDYLEEAKKLSSLSTTASESEFNKLRKSVLEKQQKIVEYARKNNFEAVEFPFEKEIRIIQPNILKTKQQLIDIYNKAQEVKPKEVKAESVPKTISGLVKKDGGISGLSPEEKKVWRENGQGHLINDEDGRSLDDMAQSLVLSGELRVPENMNPSEALKEAIQGKETTFDEKYRLAEKQQEKFELGEIKKGKEAIRKAKPFVKEAEQLSKPLTKGKVKPILHKAVGMKVDDKIEISERKALEEVLKAEQSGSREGFRVGKEEIRTFEADKRKRNKVIDGLENKISNRYKFSKPVKQGQRVVSKYDYKTNKDIQELRRINRLSGKQALSEMLQMPGLKPNTVIPEITLVKRRLLSYKANGKKSSVALMNQVLNDIEFLQEAGLTAKDQADFNKKLTRQQQMDEINSILDTKKAGAEKVATQALNLYRSGFANHYSLLNSMFNKEIAEVYDLEPFELDYVVGAYQATKPVNKGIENIYKISKGEVYGQVINLSNKRYKLVDNRGVVNDLAKADIIDIYLSMKNDLTKKRYYNSYPEDKLNELLETLSDEDKALGDLLQDSVQSYQGIYNQFSIEQTGRDNGIIDNYWMATSEHQPDVIDAHIVMGETPTANKARSRSGSVIPKPKNAISKAMKHITTGEHIKHLSRAYENQKRLFTDPLVRSNIEQKYGKNIYELLNETLDRVALNRLEKNISGMEKLMGMGINNWVVAKIALNPAVFAKQLISIMNYTETINTGKFISNFSEGVLSPKETFRYMWDNEPMLEERFNMGYSEALGRAMQDQKMFAVSKDFTDVLTLLVRSGDVGAIIYGGYGYVQTLMSEGMSKADAFKEFRKRTIKAQQSRLEMGRSQVQASKNPLLRWFLSFKNTISQYLRKQTDAMIQYYNKDISGTQLAKVLSIYGLLNPIMFALIGVMSYQGYKAIGGNADEPEDIAEDSMFAVMNQIFINPFLAIPIIDDLAMAAFRASTGQKGYKIFSTPILDDLEMARSKAKKKEKNVADVFDIIGAITEPIIPIPVKTYNRIITKYIFGVGKKEAKKKKKSSYKISKKYKTKSKYKISKKYKRG